MLIVRHFPSCFLLIGLLLTHGCATRPPAGERAAESVWLEHRAAVASLADWQVQGRVAVRQDEDGWNAGFDWRQHQGSYRLRLRGPFGQGAVELRGDRLGVWLYRSDRPPVYARSAEDLLAREIGWRLPVIGLVDWLRGLPVSSRPAVLDWDRQGRLQRLQQDGWHIDYLRYQAVGPQQLPGKLRMTREALQVRVVIDKWQVP